MSDLPDLPPGPRGLYATGPDRKAPDLAGVENPSRCLLLYEWTAYNAMLYGRHCWDVQTSEGESVPVHYSFHDMNRSMAMCAFVDGHVDYLYIVPGDYPDGGFVLTTDDYTFDRWMR